ncbi:MAG: LamG domain-containing protein, partial [Akkermansiaceae bacterium]
PILIDVVDGNGTGGGNATFENGAILDPYDLGGAVQNVWTTVMEWEGSLTDNGLVLSSDALAAGWQKQVTGNQLQVRLTPVVPGQPVINSYEASELVVFLGQTTTLLWDINGADSVEIDQGIGVVANPAGSVDVTPIASTTYTLTAANENGSTDAQVTITVIPDPVVSAFTASPGLIYTGETVTLTWEVDNFSTIEINPGGRLITESSGSVEVIPTETTTYTLTATNDNGTTEATAAVTVLPIPPPRELLLHWKFDESEGTTAFDSAGNNNGIFLETGGAITRTTGVLGDAVTFQNTNDTAVIALTELVDTYPFAISGWIKTTTTANDTFAVLGTNDGGQYHSLLVQNGSARALTRAGGFFYTNGANVNDDSWHHVIAVFEHAASARLYVDGMLTAERTAEAGEFVLPDRFGVGALARTDASVVDAFDGSVDDVSFWRGIVTGSEAAALAGGATGLGLNASDIAVILNGFDTQTSVPAAGVTWTYVSGLTGIAGTTSGSISGGDAIIVMDNEGNGMLSAPSEISIIDVEVTENSRSVIFKSNPGSFYKIEFSSDLENWFELEDNYEATETESSFVDSNVENLASPVGFYRVIFVPRVN